MRLVVAAGLLGCTCAPGQYLIDPAKTSLAAKYFDKQKDDQELHCQVRPTPARLNFGLRFQTGYVVSVPMKQYFGAGHAWAIVARVTPEGSKTPVYFGSAPVRLPNVPKTTVRIEFGGSFLLGEGRYGVDWLMFDDHDRVCRKSWNVVAKPDPQERGLKLGMAPQTVAPVTFRRWSPKTDLDVHPLRRLTVWLHAAPIFARSTKLRAGDRAILLGSLASLLESLPARSVRLVVFNLDQQKELLRKDDLTPESFDQVAQAMNGLELGLVDYKVLQNRRGHIDLLTDLVNEELRAEEKSDAVVLLGPATRFFDKLPSAALEERQGAAPQFFYFQFMPYIARAEARDSLASAIGKAKGKMMVVRTPDDFAKAIKRVQTQVAAEN